ncbi:hypothetical protein K0651_03850 [Ornithinimicrobium sp. Arc0846-15]|nr:hypothetical protein [Ornithinimicrobium laminariae]
MAKPSCFIDGEEVARDRIEATVAGRFGLDTFNVGQDAGSPVIHDYTMPFAYTGEIGQVDVRIGKSGLSKEDEDKLHAQFKAGKDN